MAALSLGVGGERAPGAGAVLAFDAGIGEAEADDPFVVLQQRSRLAAALAARVGDLAAADVWEWFDGVVGDPVITLVPPWLLQWQQLSQIHGSFVLYVY
jgi:hypothetical protein